MLKKTAVERKKLSKEAKWNYVTKPVLIIFGSLNIFILIFFLISYYR
jgi:hypothetical protein